MGIVDLVSSKKGRLYLRFFIAVAILAAAIHAYSALAANPSASPAIVTNSNPAFKWFKRALREAWLPSVRQRRTLYQPQNVGELSFDGRFTL